MTAHTAAVAALAAGAGARAGSPAGVIEKAIDGVLDGVLGGMRARLSGARSTAATIAAEVRPLLSPAGVRGAALETAWLSAHLAIYPFGLVGERGAHPERYHLDGLDPVQRGLVVGDVEAAGTPILLVHGMVDNRAVFTVLKRRLRRRGFGRVVTMNYSPATNDVRQAARDLAVQVEALVAETGYERIHVVGHSMGGLIARYYVQRLGGDERVHTLVTLGTPHGGSLPAHLLPVTVCRQLRPGSDLLAELAAPAAGCRTRFVAFWSDLDQMVLPHHRGGAHVDPARRPGGARDLHPAQPARHGRRDGHRRCHVAVGRRPERP
jgi:pimeloyl-ACP methyl ester carboxylesterase